MEAEHFTGEVPATGAVVAQGTADQPITFTRPGDAGRRRLVRPWLWPRAVRPERARVRADRVRRCRLVATGARCHPATNTYTAALPSRFTADRLPSS
jgi:hypothetical protein